MGSEAQRLVELACEERQRDDSDQPHGDKDQSEAKSAEQPESA
jgi:hypothetical protein